MRIVAQRRMEIGVVMKMEHVVVVIVMAIVAVVMIMAQVVI